MNWIVNAKVVLEKEVLENAAVAYDRQIVEVTDRPRPQPGDKLTDAGGSYLIAGLIDIHTHGAAGCDVMDATPEALEAIALSAAKSGVTSFLATTVSMPFEETHRALKNIRLCREKAFGAKILGANLEGPFISEKFRGCHLPEYLSPCDFEQISGFLDVIRMMTVAPELPGAMELIEQVRAQGTVVAMGHTGTDFGTAREAVRRGVTNVTHLFNAMSPLHHREPGCVGAALSLEVSAELIADTIHVSKELFPLVLQCKGLDKLVLITDAMCAAGMAPGEYSLGGQKVLVDGSSARLENGTLAGSVLRLNQGVKNFRRATGISLPEAVCLASRNPARVIGEKERGAVRPGNYADFALVNEELEPELTIVEGQIAYRR